MAKTSNQVEAVKSEMEIDESLDLQHKGWVVQRIGWVLMFIFLLLAATGWFGDGIFSKKKQEAGSMKIEYQRFFRHLARMEMKLETIATDKGTFVSFPSEYLQKFRIESIQPEPKENFQSTDRTSYEFNGTGPMVITFFLIPQTIGNVPGSVQVNEQQFAFHQFIYP